jgi:hypothetical protein
VTSGGGSGGVAGTAASGGAAGVTNTGGFAAVAGSAGAAGGASLGVDCNFAFNYDSTTGLATYCTAAGCTVKLTVMCNGLQGSTYTADPAADTCPAGVNYEATIDVSQCSTADIAIQLDCGTTAKGSCKVK